MSARDEYDQKLVDRLDSAQIKILDELNKIREDIGVPIDLGTLAKPRYSAVPEVILTPSVLVTITHLDEDAVLYYDLIDQDPVTAYTEPVRLDLAGGEGLSQTLYAKATNVAETVISPRQEKIFTTTIPWTHVWNLDADGSDSVGAVDLEPKGDVVINTDPNFNTATFDGLGCLMTTDVSTMKSATFTISCWAKISSNDLFRFMWVFERANSNEGLALAIHADLKMEVQLLSNSGYVQPVTASPVVILDTLQQHTVTADGTTVKYFLDGVEQASLPYDGTLDPVYIDRFVVGSEVIGADTPRYGIFGNIDRVYYMPSALTDSQVLELYNQDLLYTKI